MNRPSMKKMALTTAVAGLAAALTVGTASGAFAHDNGGRGDKGGPGAFGRMDGRMDGPRGGMRGGPLADLIAKGTITQADADAVRAALEKIRDANHAAHDAERTAEQAKVLADLVSKGTITQSQADAIAAADRGGMRDLIAKGTITQAQAEAVFTAMRAGRDAHQAAEQASRKAEVDKAIAGLVSAGTLTQAKADAIGAALAVAPMGGKGGHGMNGRGGR